MTPETGNVSPSAALRESNCVSSAKHETSPISAVRDIHPIEMGDLNGLDR